MSIWVSNRIQKHHVKYKKRDGVDETVFVNVSKHAQIHKKLRQEGIKAPIKKHNINMNVRKEIADRLKNGRDISYSEAIEELLEKKNKEEKYMKYREEEEEDEHPRLKRVREGQEKAENKEEEI